MAKMSEAVLRWRRKQKTHSIMTPETFSEIEKSAEEKGLSPERAKKSAGAAYWSTVVSKFKKSKKGKDKK